MYQAVFSLAYYGMMRVGELTYSQHCLKAGDLHVAHNKNKILVVLYTSKTHGLESRPQKIKILCSPDSFTLSLLCQLRTPETAFDSKINKLQQFFYSLSVSQDFSLFLDLTYSSNV